MEMKDCMLIDETVVGRWGILLASGVIEEVLTKGRCSKGVLSSLFI